MDSDLPGFFSGFFRVSSILLSVCGVWWRNRFRSQPRTIQHGTGNGNCGKKYWSNEGGRQKWGYVKVTMDGFVVGRKVCVLDHGGYSTLAHQLEDMFGMQSVLGLRLFEAESEFFLVYKDKEGTWGNAEDVPWKEFVESVERLRITRRKDALLSF